MLRWMLMLMIGMFSFAVVGCDDDAEIETPGGEIEIDR